MLLSARILNSVGSVNIWEYVTEVRLTEGDTTNIYLQLCDMAKDINLKPPGKRYMPASGAVLTVTIKSIDSTKTVIKTATQPFTEDPSIWTFQILPADGLKGTYTLQLALTQSSVLTSGNVKSALQIEPISGASI